MRAFTLLLVPSHNQGRCHPHSHCQVHLTRPHLMTRVVQHQQVQAASLVAVLVDQGAAAAYHSAVVPLPAVGQGHRLALCEQ